MRVLLLVASSTTCHSKWVVLDTAAIWHVLLCSSFAWKRKTREDFCAGSISSHNLPGKFAYLTVNYAHVRISHVVLARN